MVTTVTVVKVWSVGLTEVCSLVRGVLSERSHGDCWYSTTIYPLLPQQVHSSSCVKCPCGQQSKEQNLCSQQSKSSIQNLDCGRLVSQDRPNPPQHRLSSGFRCTGFCVYMVCISARSHKEMHASTYLCNLRDLVLFPDYHTPDPLLQPTIMLT